MQCIEHDIFKTIKKYSLKIHVIKLSLVFCKVGHVRKVSKVRIENDYGLTFQKYNNVTTTVPFLPDRK